MDAPINRYPGGLLGFLDIKQMGENPRFVGGQVMPYIDMTPYYLGGKRVQLSSTIPSITNVGSFSSTTPVVQGQDAFILTNVMVTGATLAAGENIRGYVYCQSAPTSAFFYTSPMSQAFVTGDSFSEGWSLPTPIILPPGTILGFYATRIGTALPGATVIISGMTITF